MAQNNENTDLPFSHMMAPAEGAVQSPILISAHKIAIAGLGLIGGSIAQRLVQHNRFVTAWNHNKRPYEQAEKKGIVCCDTLEELVKGKPDILILAVPLEAMDSVCTTIARYIHSGTTITDVGSVKGPVRSIIDASGLWEFYVGAHPMAGSEKSGFEASSSQLLDGALWALTSNHQTQYRRLITVADMITQGLDNSVICINDTVHDRAAALISHMPHVVSTALSNELVTGKFVNQQIAIALSAGSWRDMTRVSLTDPERTRAMVQMDASNVATLLDEIAGQLTSIAEDLRESQQTHNAIAQNYISDFFSQSQPYRELKKAEQIEKSKPQDIVFRDISSEHWREELLASAQAGERIVTLKTTHTFGVVQDPVIS